MDTFLYDVPPLVLERFCRVMDCGGDTLGWRALAVRVVPSYSEVRMLERLEAAGRSPTRELLWSWAQQNTRVQDLLMVLQDMGHHRALQLFQSPARESPLPQSHRHVEDDFTPSSVTPTSETQPRVITLRDIIEGTRHFHHDMRIAEGPFASVYRACVGNKTFAVKVFKQINSVSWKKQWELFRKEMEIHRMCQHPNILDLVDCFSDEGHYCLVYPYLPNGSLHHRLHQQKQECPLSWEERLAIIKGIAKALHHLHTAQPCPVICGNISSANIFLDDALQPKLSDFGLARLRPKSASQSCTITLNTGSHSNLGYLPEEYIRDGKLSSSLDVYSFGMLILEAITGRKVIEDGPRPTLLRDVFVTVVEESGGGLDSCLQFLDRTAGQWPTSMALKLLDLAMNCIVSRHRQRPNMENVLLALSELLLPPRCPLADQPHSLDDIAAIYVVHSPSSSILVEHDEQSVVPGSPAQEGPCEYSQSEVTYLSDSMAAHDEAEADLYSSFPVQCSCSSEEGGLPCEDCRANGLVSDPTGSPHSDLCVVENVAKCRLKNKLSFYNKGLIDTEELFSETPMQQGAERQQSSMQSPVGTKSQ
ncbi:interleukin-1 receptor-associated kinase 3 [Solea solea]|uniref:interleukin-1 receptor-associated kinase 3 n=1 Tax=Solea solea TaxID=90069 RepID=UPI00272B3F3B|nr:interleukin-1 receptor-associated kinase 3 [Solea solea]XP_058482031.1 interleukin-1 receptor-associated kinase 3 [Solea solea]